MKAWRATLAKTAQKAAKKEQGKSADGTENGAQSAVTSSAATSRSASPERAPVQNKKQERHHDVTQTEDYNENISNVPGLVEDQSLQFLGSKEVIDLSNGGQIYLRGACVDLRGDQDMSPNEACDKVVKLAEIKGENT